MNTSPEPEKNHILYNQDNEFIDDTIKPNTKPNKKKRTKEN